MSMPGFCAESSLYGTGQTSDRQVCTPIRSGLALSYRSCPLPLAVAIAPL